MGHKEDYSLAIAPNFSCLLLVVSNNLMEAVTIAFLIHLGHYTCAYPHAIQTSTAAV